MCRGAEECFVPVFCKNNNHEIIWRSKMNAPLVIRCRCVSLKTSQKDWKFRRPFSNRINIC